MENLRYINLFIIIFLVYIKRNLNPCINEQNPLSNFLTSFGYIEKKPFYLTKKNKKYKKR